MLVVSPRATRGACTSLFLIAATLPLSSVAAQEPLSTSRALAQWIDLDVQPGDERSAATILRRADSRWQQDAQGNLVLTVGTGHPHRVIACSLDHTGYVVSQITDDAYIRLHRGGSQPSHPLWDQFHQGQQVVVRTTRGLVPGVVAIPNGHFARQHRGDSTVVNVDQLWVDVGVRTRAEAEALGIALIDPVRRDVPAWSYPSYVAGADASGRAGCAAIAAAARADSAPASGSNTYILATLRSFNNLGASGALAQLGAIDELTIVNPSARAASASAVTQRRVRWPYPQGNLSGLDSVSTLSVRARWVGSLVESVSTDDAEALRRAVASVAGVSADAAPWLALDTMPPTRVVPRAD